MPEPTSTDAERVQEIMEALVAAAMENPDLDPQVFVREFTADVLNISEEETAYLTAHGQAAAEFPPDSYDNLWDVYGMSEKGFAVMVQQVRDMGEQDTDNRDPNRLEAWVEGYMCGIIIERSVQKALKEASDAGVE